MVASDRRWIAIVLVTGLFAGCGDGGGGSGGRGTPTPTGTPAPCPQQITYTMTGVPSDLDFGWTGLLHDQTSGGGGSLSFGLTCSGTTTGHCGACAVDGPIQSTTAVDNHRCVAATEIRCTDDAACPSTSGTPACGFFFQAPLPITGGGTSVCVVSRIAGAAKGTVTPDNAGGGPDLTVELAMYSPSDPGRPCPRCNGAALGEAGTCEGGPRDGQACTVDATYEGVDSFHISFGSTSFDCPPDPAARLGATTAHLALTSGTSSLAPTVTCSGTDAQCYCPGQVQPNGCGDDSPCVIDQVNDKEGVCIPGPVDAHTCVFDAFRTCVSDADCPRTQDSCTIRPRECFGGPDTTSDVTKPMVRVGGGSLTDLRLAATFCLGATGHAALDAALGLPGPGTARLPTTVCTDQHCP